MSKRDDQIVIDLPIHADILSTLGQLIDGQWPGATIRLDHSMGDGKCVIELPSDRLYLEAIEEDGTFKFRGPEVVGKVFIPYMRDLLNESEAQNFLTMTFYDNPGVSDPDFDPEDHATKPPGWDTYEITIRRLSGMSPAQKLTKMEELLVLMLEEDAPELDDDQLEIIQLARKNIERQKNQTPDPEEVGT